ncbi:MULTISPECIES: sigma-70 family RNA polymerase sigma factor [unclassified Rhizobium]|uniref:sigma-70 family RNA polymerase sigma factor n=1 Tax=unclassified Rhizobium TaxID=2613769 RepID=UPI001ADD424A|nr:MULTISPECIES: sigma-70 family RNA polymerase sigma factor [unclassified Rhizobium]MBO9101713.1 sigma-70 family RNA polymerase sigma factor [Rhizobium sp. L58/93]MBO9136894.1 sigma-70 family RNA polymerase sigma factor [Rhizobium sp. B209b/85]MBO9172433.1 sigma-70 family RNA polymerase sigma factor [Rhizobium sp. L245/93]MBO9187048.1 sigma-70 family RNA polymerase sigma factor [Rhizobium sp. E27B/91]QXZ86128.1 sigma-70 family RNA polymerase sigma factor [Rhizobium sp. K1/93]
MNPREKLWADAMCAERRGDVVAYERLLADIAKTLRSMIRGRLSRLGMQGHETEDIVQEVLIGLHTMRHRWDTTRPFMPWLHAIVRYKLSDAMRKRRREARFRCDLKFEDWLTIADSKDDDRNSSRVDIDRQIRQLSAGQRDVVRALAIDGASVRETAQKLRTSEGAVRVTLHRAFQRLTVLANLEKPVPGKKKL